MVNKEVAWGGSIKMFLEGGGRNRCDCQKDHKSIAKGQLETRGRSPDGKRIPDSFFFFFFRQLFPPLCCPLSTRGPTWSNNITS